MSTIYCRRWLWATPWPLGRLAATRSTPMVEPLRFAADDGSASQPHSSLTTALGDDYGAPSPVFHAFGATAAPVTMSIQNRLIDSLFSKNAL